MYTKHHSSGSGPKRQERCFEVRQHHHQNLKVDPKLRWSYRHRSCQRVAFRNATAAGSQVPKRETARTICARCSLLIWPMGCCTLPLDPFQLPPTAHNNPTHTKKKQQQNSPLGFGTNANLPSSGQSRHGWLGFLRLPHVLALKGTARKTVARASSGLRDRFQASAVSPGGTRRECLQHWHLRRHFPLS